MAAILLWILPGCLDVQDVLGRPEADGVELRIETSRDLLPFQTGVAMMAIKTGVTVYPAYLDGTQRGKEMVEAVATPNRARLTFFLDPFVMEGGVIRWVGAAQGDDLDDDDPEVWTS